MNAERKARAADPREEGLREARKSLDRIKGAFGLDLTDTLLDDFDAVRRALAATPARAAAPRPFRVTDPDLDAPDGAILTFERVGGAWEPLAAAEPARLPLDAVIHNWTQEAASARRLQAEDGDSRPEWRYRAEAIEELLADLRAASPATSQGTGEEEA